MAPAGESLPRQAVQSLPIRRVQNSGELGSSVVGSLWVTVLGYAFPNLTFFQGAPVALCPYKDDPQLAVDPKRNNNFDYRVRGVPGVSPREHSALYCPFFTHTRKTVPRNLDPYIQQAFLESSMIVRGGLPYGPEVMLDNFVMFYYFVQLMLAFSA